MGATQRFVAVMFIFVFLAFGVYFFHPFTPDNSYASTNNISVSYTGSDYSIGISTSSDTIDISASPNSTLTTTNNTVTTTTDASGYQLYISMEGDTNKLLLDGTTESQNRYISPSAGSYSSSAALDTNQWGYGIPSGQTGVTGNFDVVDSYSGATSTKWAGVNISGSEQLVQSVTNSSGAGTSFSEDLVIYYGTKVNANLPAGDYKGTIVYTAIAS